MSWVAQTPSSFVGQPVGNEQCVAYVQVASGAPHTSQWKRGNLVKGSAVPQGTAIATSIPMVPTAITSMGGRTRLFFMKSCRKGCWSGISGFITPSRLGSFTFATGRALRSMTATSST